MHLRLLATLALAVLARPGFADPKKPAIRTVTAGLAASCAVDADGKVTCWGHIALENGVTRPSPTAIPKLDNVVAIDPEGDICALRTTGTVSCWRTGLLRSKSQNQQFDPFGLYELPVKNVAELSLGSGSGCARLRDGTISCWGRNEIGQGGNGKKQDLFAPTPVPGLSGITQLAGNAYSHCAVLADHTVRCWGYNAQGELGDGTKTTRLQPTPIKGLTKVTQVVLGSAHGCALDDGRVKCWGTNTIGQLGDTTTKSHFTPAEVKGLSGIVAIAAGGGGTCALDAKATVWCWGNAAPVFETRNAPVRVLDNIASVSVGGDHACALGKDGTVQCWGGNGDGQLGDGSLVQSRKPKLVSW